MPRSGLGQDMGLGRLSDADLVFKRKYRWTLEIQGLCVGDIPPFYVKTAARPNLTIDETEINHLHGKTWIPGKGTWETIQVTYYDVQNNAALSTLWSWLASVYNFTDFNGMHQASTRRGYAGTGILKLYDGCGQVMEEWNLYHCGRKPQILAISTTPVQTKWLLSLLCVMPSRNSFRLATVDHL